MPEPTPSTPTLVLYQRDDCHLCDLALDVLAEVRVPDFESVFIDGDEGLEARYGARVPVLRDTARGVELDWPFDGDRLRRWCAALLVLAMPLVAQAGIAGTPPPDVDLVKGTAASAGAVPGRALADYLDGGVGDSIERFILTGAVTSLPPGLDLGGVRQAFERASGPSRAARTLQARLLRTGSDDAHWEGVVLMKSGTAHAFAIGHDELCLQGPDGATACWTLRSGDAISPD